MKTLGLDVGTRTIGVAVSDPTGKLARGLTTIRFEEGAWSRAARDVVAIAVRENVIAIVIGLPKNMDGSEGDQAAMTRAFGDTLKGFIAVPIHYQDERLSSRLARRQMIDATMRKKKRQSRIDTQAATIILQAHLDAKP